jgi:flagellar protein FliO/FliZ
MDFWDSALRMLSALAVVLALMMVVVAIARRMMGHRALVRPEAPMVQVLSTGYLGPRKTISVVAVAGDLLIVGATATDLIPLGRVRNTESVQRLVPQASGGVVARSVETVGWMP